MGNVGTGMGKISCHTRLCHTLGTGFGIDSTGTERTVYPYWSTIVRFTHQFCVQGEKRLSPTVAVV